MCISNHNLYKTVESAAVVLLTISVLTIGTSIYLFVSIVDKLASVVICFLNIFFSVTLIFGVKEKNKLFVLLWMVAAVGNVLGGLVMFSSSSYDMSFGNNSWDFLPTNESYFDTYLFKILKTIVMASYTGFYIWSFTQVFHLYKEF